MSNLPTDKLPGRMQEFVDKGFSNDEAKLLNEWIESGKPGLAKLRAEGFGSIYALGYTCQDIQKWFPEYPLPLLLWARLTYGWDATRAQYIKSIQEQTMQQAGLAKADSIKFITEMISATHMKWRKEIMNYLASPDREKAPDCLPNSLHQYGGLIKLLQDIMTPVKGKGGADDLPSVSLVSVNINTATEKKTIDVNPVDIKEALRKELDKKNER